MIGYQKMLLGDIAGLIWFKDEIANLISFSTRTYNMPTRVKLEWLLVWCNTTKSAI
jgi:hypothetical protein